MKSSPTLENLDIQHLRILMRLIHRPPMVMEHAGVILRAPIALVDCGTSTTMNINPSDRVDVKHLLDRGALGGVRRDHPTDDVVQRAGVIRIDHKGLWV